jgi:hypothetical protein
MKRQHLMNNKYRYLLFVSFILILTLEACTKLPSLEVKPTDYWHCIPPLVKYDYSLSTTADPNMPQPTPLPVTKDWEPQLSPEQQEEIDLRFLDTLVYYGDSIWMTTDSLQLARFQPDEHMLTFYTVRVDELSEFVPNKLFVTSKQELWGIGNFGIGTMEVWPSYTGKFRGILSRFDPELDRFLPVIDQDNLLVDTVGEQFIDDDSHGNFIVLVDEMVIRFNPNTLKAEILLDQSDGFAFYRVLVGPDDKIWFSAQRKENPSNGENEDYANELVRYDPASRGLETFGTPPGEVGVRLPFPLYFDQNGRLWAGENRLEISSNGDYEWYTLVDQPEFVRVREGLPEITVSKYFVVSLSPVFEASDNSMWFKGIGLLRLDPERGKWCRITDDIAFITEDDEGNLWMVQGSQLYKKRLKP